MYKSTDLNLVDFDKGSRQSQLEFFQKNLELGRRYANNKTKEWENNTLHLMIENFTKDIISDVPGANKAGGILSEEWKGFIKKRQELAAANPSLNISLPTSYLEMVPPTSFEKDQDTNIPIDDGQETTAYDSSISLLKVTPDKELPKATFKRICQRMAYREWFSRKRKSKRSRRRKMKAGSKKTKYVSRKRNISRRRKNKYKLRRK